MRLAFLLLMLPSSILAAISSSSSSSSMSKPNCSEKCGNIAVPYPFGMGSGQCSASPSFLIDCRDSTDPPTLFLPSIGMQVTNISVEGTIVVKYPVTPMNCTAVEKRASQGRQFAGSPFTISADRNTLVVIGCRNSVFLNVNDTVFTGCNPTCRLTQKRKSCQIDIPPRSQELMYNYRSAIPPDNTTQHCGYAFPVDKTWWWLGKSYGLYKGLRDYYSSPFDDNLTYVPLVLDWELSGAKIDEYARCNYPYDYSIYFTPPSYTPCHNPYYGMDSYQYAAKQCLCCLGYRGNPYLDGGCVDIDECEEDPNACHDYGTCVNNNGSHTCHHQPPRLRVRNILLVSFGGLFLAGIFVPCVSKMALKLLKARRRRKFFVRNGGLLLEQKLSSIDNEYKKSKLFTSEELEQATDHYSENRILGRGGQGTVYKGMLTDGSIVAVKKSKTVDESDGELFINVILSQIIHRNIVRLLGCCLETETPLLVYEFVPNGTLYQHIHGPSEDFPLTWEMRLRIAAEIAGALSYLHSSTSAPIFHRDVKSTNVLLDGKYRAKVSDFGTSRTVAVDQSHFTTRVCGTFGYLDPEYFQSNQFTEKSDVYSFGVVMVELLTGEKAVTSLRAESGRSLATHFLHSMEEGKLLDIVDARIVGEGGGREEEIATMAGLAGRCLHLNGRLRPTMRQVANALESIIQIKRSAQRGYDDRDGVSGPDEPTEIDFSSISPFLSI